jgi:hypothetical protein
MSVDGPVALWAADPAYGRDQVIEPGDEPELRDVALRAYGHEGAVRTSVRVAELPVEWPLVDVLADGSFLVVGARCRWRSSGPDQNALAIDQDGAIARTGCLGDGIEHLQVAADGSIWAGYFDEGVFGSNGWLSPGPAPLGAAGIVRWSPEFEKEWELDPGVGVADCASLNVAGDEVLACPWTGGHPVLRIASGTHRVFPTDGVSGVVGIVASGNRIGLIGGHDDPSLLVVGSLVDGTFVESGRDVLRAPDGSSLPAWKLHCRGPVAHFFVDSQWFSLDLDDLGQLDRPGHRRK